MKCQKVAILAKLYDYNGVMSKQWYVFYSVRNPRSGKMVRFRSSKGLNVSPASARYRAAELIIKDLNIRLKNGWTPYIEYPFIYQDNLPYKTAVESFNDRRSKNRTWNFVHSQFLKKIEGIVRKATYQSYQSKFRIFEAWLKEKDYLSNDISEFSTMDAADFIQYLKEKRGICGEGLNEYVRLFRQVNKPLIKSGNLPSDPFVDMARFKHTAQSPFVFPDELIIKIKEYALKNDPQLWVIIRFIFYCFIRPRELRFLKIKNIDWISGIVTVPGSISKNHKTQPVVIPQHFLDELKELGYDKAPQDFYLFSTRRIPDINCVSKNYMFVHFDKIRKALNIPKDYKFYSWKHSGGVRLKKAGVDIIDIKNQFRHHSLDELYNYLCSLEGSVSDRIKFDGPRI